jgi:Ion channel
LRVLIASILLLEADGDMIPIGVIVLGGAMMVLITLIHGAGLDRIVARYKRRAKMLREKSWHPRLAVFVFAGTILLMLFLHMAEVCLWGLALRTFGLVLNFRDAAYFSANTYTTLGMGPMLLPHSWRELSPIIAITGLFTFAWTTSELFNIVGYQHDLVAELSSKRQQRTEPQRSDPNPAT